MHVKPYLGQVNGRDISGFAVNGGAVNGGFTAPPFTANPSDQQGSRLKYDFNRFKLEE